MQGRPDTGHLTPAPRTFGADYSLLQGRSEHCGVFSVPLASAHSTSERTHTGRDNNDVCRRCEMSPGGKAAPSRGPFSETPLGMPPAEPGAPLSVWQLPTRVV